MPITDSGAGPRVSTFDGDRVARVMKGAGGDGEPVPLSRKPHEQVPDDRFSADPALSIRLVRVALRLAPLQ